MTQQSKKLRLRAAFASGNLTIPEQYAGKPKVGKPAGAGARKTESGVEYSKAEEHTSSTHNDTKDVNRMVTSDRVWQPTPGILPGDDPLRNLVRRDEVYNELLKVLSERIRPEDVASLRIMATAIAMCERIEEQLLQEGFTVRDAVSGFARRHPLLVPWKAAISTVTSMAERFGMTPLARARLGIREEGQQSLADLLRAARVSEDA